MIIDGDDIAGEVLVPRPDQSVTAVAPPGGGPGYWVGGPSAVECEGDIYLAYRLRRPLGMGRGYAVEVARSRDGEHFETLLTITKEEMRAESLERPALVRTAEGIWRLYLSCGTYGTKHWRVELIEAANPAGFDARQSRVALPGDVKTAVKDPVIVHHGGIWHLWASCHPLENPTETDQMVSDYATWESKDGLSFRFHMVQKSDTAVTNQTDGSAHLTRTGGPGEVVYRLPKETKAALDPVLERKHAMRIERR